MSCNIHLTLEPPRPTRPVTRVLHRGHVASEYDPPELQIIPSDESYRARPVPHACTAISPIESIFPFHAYTSFLGPFDHFLLHSYIPYPADRPTISFYEPRTQFFLTVSPKNLDGPGPPLTALAPDVSTQPDVELFMIPSAF
ncbi:hypothetical protein MVEN_01406600 [Mycena venus]|uniref:Uncharacterized protein n=1 Tax=Mycena venus TaxID=2733690 RepID=A0A8H7CSR3_9AGAR|nr:hypothetical protein MVEN_01406600 [Mycena venus]